jgi:hypothetical protein
MGIFQGCQIIFNFLFICCSRNSFEGKEERKRKLTENAVKKTFRSERYCCSEKEEREQEK